MGDRNERLSWGRLPICQELGRLAICFTAACCLFFSAGCASFPWPFRNKDPAGTESAQAKSSAAAAAKSSGSTADADALKQVMSELQEVGAIDPAAREQLIADLKQTDPSRWPLVVQEFRAAAAYRRRADSE